MKLTKEFIIKDILDYEVNNDVSIFEELQNCNISVVIDLIGIGNKCDEEEAQSLFNRYIKDYSIEEIIEELAYEVIGKRPDENDDTHDSTEYTSFSEILEEFYNSIQTIDNNLGLNDFWNISTRYMYRYADGLQSRYIHNKNMELQSQYSSVAMFMSALGGKLKECPQLNEDGSIHTQDIADKLRAIKERR